MKRLVWTMKNKWRQWYCFPMHAAPNAVETLKQPGKHPTVEKAEAGRDASRHFCSI